MTHRRPPVGSVVEIPLPTGEFAYGRVLSDASLAIYRSRMRGRGELPIGSRDFEFVVGVYDDVLRDGKWPVVGDDPSRDEADDWPPPYVIRDAISGGVQLYHRGIRRPASEAEAPGLEPAAVWDRGHIVERLVGSPDRRQT